MKRILFSILAIGTAATMLSSCQKQASVQASSQSWASALSQFSANHYEGGSIYQVELSANISGTQGGGLWLWIGLHPDGSGDYSGADCGHGGAGAASDKGDVTWHLTGNNNESIEIDGVILVGLGGFPTTITVPSTYGHYTGTIGTFLTLPGFIPPFIGTSQLQVAP
jgi:hypothetical protein